MFGQHMTIRLLLVQTIRTSMCICIYIYIYIHICIHIYVVSLCIPLYSMVSPLRLACFYPQKNSRGSPMSTSSMSEMSSHSPSIPVGQVRFLGVGLVADPRTSKLWQPDIARTMEKFWGRFGLISILPYRVFEIFSDFSVKFCILYQD